MVSGNDSVKQIGPALKGDWAFRGMFAPVADWMNRVTRRVSRVYMVGGEGRFTDDGLKIVIFSQSTGAWAHSVAANKVTIQAGYFIIDGYSGAQVPETELTVAGGTEAVPHWIMLVCPRGSPASSATVIYRASAPNPANAAQYEIPLANVYLSGTAPNVSAVVASPRWCVGCPIIISSTI